MIQGTKTLFCFKASFIIGLLFLSSCTTATSLPLSPTATEISAPLPTANFIPSPSSTPPSSCPGLNPSAEYILPKTNDKIAESVLSFLNAGGEPAKINAHFPQSAETFGVVVADLNEDGLNEIVLAGALPWEMKASGNGGIFIFECEQKSYDLVKQLDFPDVYSVKIRIETLLADYPPQTIIEYLPISGRTSEVLIIGFMNSDWQVLFQDGFFLPDLIIFDQDNDGNQEISIHTVTNATQGPWKTLISNFKWDGEQYSLASELLMPGTTRVEYLDDAQNALNKNDISMAIAYYNFAAYTLGLADYASRGEIEQKQTDLTRDYQISFSLFRLSTLWFSVKDFDKGASITEELEEEFPAKSPGNEFTQAAILFKDAMQQGKTPEEACQSVTRFLIQNYPKINLHIGSWGMLVVEYTQPMEICPFH